MSVRLIVHSRRKKQIVTKKNCIPNMKLRSIKKWSAALAFPLFLSACSTPTNISYMQDLQNGNTIAAVAPMIKVQEGDKISITVKSKNSELAELFNLSISANRIGSTTKNNSQQMSCYTVANDGTVEVPILGKVKVAGMTREEVAEKVKQQLISQSLLKDAVVTVEFENLHYSVMGEVNSPGQFSIDRDRISLLDALSNAGDLTIYGRRDNVMVMRLENGKQQVYRVDLTNGSDLFNSPVCYLQQNDVVYVDPNDTRKRQSTVNGNTALSYSFWISLASFATSLAVLIFR